MIHHDDRKFFTSMLELLQSVDALHEIEQEQARGPTAFAFARCACAYAAGKRRSPLPRHSSVRPQLQRLIPMLELVKAQAVPAETHPPARQCALSGAWAVPSSFGGLKRLRTQASNSRFCCCRWVLVLPFRAARWLRRKVPRATGCTSSSMGTHGWCALPTRSLTRADVMQDAATPTVSGSHP